MTPDADISEDVDFPSIPDFVNDEDEDEDDYVDVDEDEVPKPSNTDEGAEVQRRRATILTRHLLAAVSSSTGAQGHRRVAIVTDGGRGIGRGCALALSRSGMVVYITGRSVSAAAAEITTAVHDGNSADPGVVIALSCDHSDDRSTAAAFSKVQREQGRLDLLVNNATQSAINRGKFWEEPASTYDTRTDIGLRSHFISSRLAVKLMMKSQCPGLIVNISSFGAVQSCDSVVYAMGKRALDRMTADAAVELEGTDVCMVSLYPGLAKTEGVLASMGERVAHSTDAEFIGRAVVALASDNKVGSKSGKVLIAQELVDEYGFTEVESSMPHDSFMHNLGNDMSLVSLSLGHRTIPPS